jgi:hypothetical protein
MFVESGSLASKMSTTGKVGADALPQTLACPHVSAACPCLFCPDDPSTRLVQSTHGMNSLFLLEVRENEVGEQRRTVCVFAHLLSGEDRNKKCEDRRQLKNWKETD